MDATQKNNHFKTGQSQNDIASNSLSTSDALVQPSSTVSLQNNELPNQIDK